MRSILEELPEINWDSKLSDEDLSPVYQKSLVHQVRNRNNHEKLPWYWQKPWDEITSGRWILVNWKVKTGSVIDLQKGTIETTYAIKKINITSPVIILLTIVSYML